MRRSCSSRERLRRFEGSKWPEAVRRLAGAGKEFPEVEELRADLGEDAPRERL